MLDYIVHRAENSEIGIEAVYMCFNETGLWGGETISQILTSIDAILSNPWSP